MSNRIESTFAELKAKNSTALITFIMAGDPNLAASEQMLNALPDAGASIIEIGMPFSDPMADGPIIQAAGIRALQAGTKLKDILAMVGRFRKTNHSTPVVLMGYYNPVYHYGIEKFCQDATSVGVDGMILVDLPPEEEDEFIQVANPCDLKLIRLIAPTTDDNRLKRLSKHAGGFLYYIAVAGVTGTKSADQHVLAKRVKHIASQVTLPIAVGFGIRTPEQAAETSRFCNAVVVGSALVDVFAKQEQAAAENYVKSLRSALKR